MCGLSVVGVLSVVLSWWLVPVALRHFGEKIGTEQIGRDVQIGAVDFLPWSLELTVRDVRVAGLHPDDPPVLRLERLYLEAQWQSLWRLAPVLDALELDSPVLHITQQAPGQYDIDDILARVRAAAKSPEERAQPAAFALYNMVLRGGAVEFQDNTVGQTHRLRDVQLQLPFLSSLPLQSQIKVQPHLAFDFNGSHFESSAEAIPFAPQRQADIGLRWSGLDLQPYAGYLPASLPVRLQSALLDADLHLHFEQDETKDRPPVLRLSGNVVTRQLQVSDTNAEALLSFDVLKVELKDVRPLERTAQLQLVQLDAPKIRAHRNPQGRLNWDGAAAKPAPAPVVDDTAPLSPKGHAWRVEVDSIRVNQAALDWQDDSLATPARLGLREMRLQASQLHWPLQQPVQFSGQTQLLALGDPRPTARFAFHGEATDRKAKLALSVQALPLAWARPYLAASLLPSVDGVLAADLGLAWHDRAVVAQIAQLTVDGLELGCVPRTPCTPAAVAAPATANTPGLALRAQNTLAELKKLRIEGAQIDMSRRAVTVQAMTLTQPRLLVQRSSQGRWMFEDWLPPAAVLVPTSSLVPAPPPWSVQWADLALHGGSVAFRDESAATPVALLVSGLQVQLKNFAPLAAKAPPTALSFSARLGAGRTDPGHLQYDGTVTLAPWAAQGKVQAQQLPLHAFMPYMADTLNVAIRRADGSFQGELAYAQTPAGAQLSLNGDAALDDVRVRTLPAANPEAGVAENTAQGLRSFGRAQELINWKSLAVRGLSVMMAPGKPLQVEVRETAWMDFFARVVVQEDGRINLQDWRKTVATPPAVAIATEAAPAPPPVVALAPVIHIGPITLTGGRVDFSDYFIKPNYSADLSALSGRLSSFSSVPAAPDSPPLMADLELRGRAQGTASLEITGQLNPLAQPLALNIRGKMRDMELPPLSPYTIKYAGHGIERGKLSMDVSYQVLPNGQLTAGNKLTLNQLKFGDPVEGAPASLPVRLAVALLADRNGVIDVDLPISGSLNDPEFRLGAVIFKVVGNLILKAVTAPFSLLTGLFSGSSEAGMVAFMPGTAQLDATARQNLDKVAQAMQDRPALNMTVVGQASTTAEQDAWRRDRLDQLVLAQKRRVAVRAGQDAEAIESVSTEEYPVLLKEIYRRADLKKERNLIGMTKEVPLAQMEDVLLGSISVPDNAMRELALARAVAVRDYLALRDLPLERLFLGAPETIKADATWKPRAALSLEVR